MRIIKVKGDGIYFDNNKAITYYHDQDCCEHNYADFEQIDDLALTTEFDEELKFEEIENSGFRFGNENKMFFIPCYSKQNGYYSSDIEIYYNGNMMLNFNCEEVG